MVNHGMDWILQAMVSYMAKLLENLVPCGLGYSLTWINMELATCYLGFGGLSYL